MTNQSLWQLLFLSSLCISSICFNKAITCVANRMVDGDHMRNLFLSIFYSDQMGLMEQLSLLVHVGSTHGKEITFNVDALTPSSNEFTLGNCKNILMHNNSCCPETTFKYYGRAINGAWDFYIGKPGSVVYPWVHYAMQLSKKMRDNNCLNYDVTTDAASRSYVSEVKKRMDRIHHDDRIFINETSCLVCLGIKDYTNFIYPSLNDTRQNKNQLIYQKEYFNNRTNVLTDLLMEIEGYYENFSNAFLNNANRMRTSSSICSQIRSQATAAKLSQKRLCTNRATCKKFVVKNFGYISIPLLTARIKSVSFPGFFVFDYLNNYAISNDPEYGYKGNQTGYKPKYKIRYLQDVNIYDASRSYQGLY